MAAIALLSRSFLTVRTRVIYMTAILSVHAYGSRYAYVMSSNVMCCYSAIIAWLMTLQLFFFFFFLPLLSRILNDL